MWYGKGYNDGVDGCEPKSDYSSKVLEKYKRQQPEVNTITDYEWVTKFVSDVRNELDSDKAIHCLHSKLYAKDYRTEQLISVLDSIVSESLSIEEIKYMAQVALDADYVFTGDVV